MKLLSVHLSAIINVFILGLLKASVEEYIEQQKERLAQQQVIERETEVEIREANEEIKAGRIGGKEVKKAWLEERCSREREPPC